MPASCVNVEEDADVIRIDIAGAPAALLRLPVATGTARGARLAVMLILLRNRRVCGLAGGEQRGASKRGSLSSHVSLQ
eukprot:11085656-Prorocentrum_lima.AAC.1